MPFIDWSDSEYMFGLLLDFIADERAECRDDPERRRFLSDLSARLAGASSPPPDASPTVLIRWLRDAEESADAAFVRDPVMLHVRDCIEELERLEGESD